MHRIARRRLLRTAACLPVAALVACAAQPPSQLATDVALIASGLAAAIASIKQIPGVPSAAVAQLEAELAVIEADARQVAAATTNPPASVVLEIGQLVQAVAAVALPLIPGGSALTAIVQAALSLLPVVLGTVGVAGAGVQPHFAPDEARAILASVR